MKNTETPKGIALPSYIRAAVAAGCPQDQMLNFLKAGVALQPRQLAASAAARLCDRPDGPLEIAFGGARGGGKSYWLLAQMGLDDCQRFPNLKCLLLRRVGRANLEHFQDLRQRLFCGLPHDFAAYRGVLRFENGSQIIAGHFQKESDIDNYLGLEYDVIGIEEATTLAPQKYRDICTCSRSSKWHEGMRWRPRIYSTANPGGVGHSFYKARFVDPFRVGAETTTRFVPALATDNRFNNPEYHEVLARLTGWQRRAWKDGDWEIQAGQFFANFRRADHVISHFDDAKGVEWFAAMDYGFTHYTAVLLGCRDSDGNVFVVDEHCERLWVPERHAAATHAMLARHGVRAGMGPEDRRLRFFAAGTDVFSRESDGSSVASQYAAQGITLKPAATSRINGWAEITARLGDPSAGVRPRLFIHERCARLIECLPMLQRDPLRPEDVLKWDVDEDGRGGDDPADALRYMLAQKPVTAGALVG